MALANVQCAVAMDTTRIDIVEILMNVLLATTPDAVAFAMAKAPFIFKDKNHTKSVTDKGRSHIIMDAPD